MQWVKGNLTSLYFHSWIVSYTVNNLVIKINTNSLLWCYSDIVPYYIFLDESNIILIVLESFCEIKSWGSYIKLSDAQRWK